MRGGVHAQFTGRRELGRFDHGRGAVVDDRAGHPTEVRERAAVAVEEDGLSMLATKQQNGSLKYDRVMWNE